MTSNKEISNELLSISPTLADISNANVFRVPDNYFNELPSSILQLLQTDITPSFSKAEKQPLSVPEGYFDGLASSILSKIKAESPETVAEEMSALSPAIARIGNKNIFTVPEGYFEAVSTGLLQEVKPVAKVVEMKKRTGFVKYMAAAAVAGVIGLTIFNQVNKPARINNNNQSELFAEANEIIKNKSFDKELNALSDKDIEQYLTENGEDVNAALVASMATDDAALPAPEDYIVNDSTLDNLLNKVNLNN